MTKKVFLIYILLVGVLYGFAQSTGTAPSGTRQKYELVTSNDSDHRLDSIWIDQPKRCLLSDGSIRLFFSVHNGRSSPFNKYSIIVYYQSHKVFKSKLPNLKPGEVFNFAINLDEKKADYSAFQFKLRRKKAYRIYQYAGKKD